MAEKTQPSGASGAELLNDPNCTITIVPQNSIPDYADSVSNDNISDAQYAINQLTFFDIWKLPPHRTGYGSILMEVRGVTAGGGRDWRIYISGMNGNSVISSIIVEGNLATASTDDRRQYVQHMVRNALQQSLSNKYIMVASGPCK